MIEHKYKDEFGGPRLILIRNLNEDTVYVHIGGEKEYFNRTEFAELYQAMHKYFGNES